MRRLGLLIGLAGCSVIGASQRPAPRLLRYLWVSPGLDSAVATGPAVQSYCIPRWSLSGDTLTIHDATPTPEKVSVLCFGQPVFLVRPTCTLTASEALFYPTSTPVVALRCPYGASGYITGFSKAQRGRFP